MSQECLGLLTEGLAGASIVIEEDTGHPGAHSEAVICSDIFLLIVTKIYAIPS